MTTGEGTTAPVAVQIAALQALEALLTSVSSSFVTTFQLHHSSRIWYSLKGNDFVRNGAHKWVLENSGAGWGFTSRPLESRSRCSVSKCGDGCCNGIYISKPRFGGRYNQLHGGHQHHQLLVWRLSGGRVSSSAGFPPLPMLSSSPILGPRTSCLSKW